jgi:hypothetical protein
MSGPKRIPIKRRHTARITAEAIASFRDDDATTLHRLLHLAPWEISPLQVHEMNEPDLDNCREDGRIWLSSWWRAMALREELLTALGNTNEIATTARE